MTGEREILIPCIDLTRLSIICKKCAGEVTANIAETRQTRLRSEHERYLCSICREELDGRIGPALMHLSEWFRLIRESEHTALFRIKEPVSE